MPQVYVPQHPLVAHWLAVCRNKMSPPPIFRSAVAELGRVLIYEAAADWLPTVDGQVETPLALAECALRGSQPSCQGNWTTHGIGEAARFASQLPFQSIVWLKLRRRLPTGVRSAGGADFGELGWCCWSRQQRFCRHQRRIMWAMSGMRPHYR